MDVGPIGEYEQHAVRGLRGAGSDAVCPVQDARDPPLPMFGRHRTVPGTGS